MRPIRHQTEAGREIIFNAISLFEENMRDTENFQLISEVPQQAVRRLSGGFHSGMDCEILPYSNRTIAEGKPATVVTIGKLMEK